MALAKAELAELYRRRARNYDFTANLYYLVGFREQAFRRRAVAALELERGDTVVEICCGTGLNFPLLRGAVGQQGRVIGVDLTDAMLEQARQRVQERGWSNVDLVLSDAARYRFPERVDGVISTFALTLVPEYDDVIRRAAAALAPGGRMAVLDFKEPEHWPRWLLRFAVAMTRPFGVTWDLMDRKPWKSMERWFDSVDMQELFWGSTYVCTGAVNGSQRGAGVSTEEEQP